MTKILDNWKATLNAAQCRHLDDMAEYHTAVRHNPKTGYHELPRNASEAAKRYYRNIGKVTLESLK